MSEGLAAHVRARAKRTRISSGAGTRSRPTVLRETNSLMTSRPIGPPWACAQGGTVRMTAGLQDFNHIMLEAGL